MDWLASLPGWLLILVSVALFSAVALGVRRLLERVSRDHPRENHHTVAGQLMPGICAIFGIIAGLTLVGQVDNWNRAQDAVAREASAAARLAWATADAPAGQGLAAIPLREAVWPRTVGITTRRSAYLSPLVLRFLDIVRERAEVFVRKS